MLRVGKPKNARSKRALEKRESKEFEHAKTAIFVKGTKTSEKVNMALSELALLKKPDAVAFNKRNDVLPFEDASSIEFWGQKNDLITCAGSVCSMGRFSIFLKWVFCTRPA